MRRRSSPYGGFTLIEVLVALVILSTGIVVVLRAFQTSLFALSEARDALRASMLMRDTLAETELAVIQEGASALRRLDGGFSGPGDWVGTLSIDKEVPPEVGAGSNGLFRVEIDLWRRDAGTHYGGATYVVAGEKAGP